MSKNQDNIHLKFFGIDTVLLGDFVPNIIDTNQNAENIGLEIDYILFNSGIEVNTAMRTDAAIIKLILA